MEDLKRVKGNNERIVLKGDTEPVTTPHFSLKTDTVSDIKSTGLSPPPTNTPPLAINAIRTPISLLFPVGRCGPFLTNGPDINVPLILFLWKIF